MDRLFVPAALSGLLAGMPPVGAAPGERWEWLDGTRCRLRQMFQGPHGLEAMRLAKVIDQARRATHDEIDEITAAAA